MGTQQTSVNLRLLTRNDKNIIPGAYIPVFEGHPWHEEFECICGSGPYSLGCDIAEKEKGNKFDCEEFKTGKLFALKDDNQICDDCGKELSRSLSPIFTIDSVKTDYLKCFENPGFLGVGAFRFGKLVGLCWGFDFPLNYPSKKGSTWYNEVIPLLEDRDINPTKVFYHNESGTLPAHRNLGIGTEVLREMLLRSSRNHEYVAFRTINPPMIRCYEKAFGQEKDSLMNQPSFKDPNPNKRQQWYVLGLNQLNE